MKRTNTQPSAPLPGSSFSPDARKIPNNVQLETGRRRSSRNGAVIFGLVVFALAVAVVLAVAQMAFGNIGVGALVLAAVAGWLAVSSVHIVLEWEKAVVLRLGKFNRVAGPGVVFTWPIIEFYTLRVDQRVSATYFGAEETLTSDLVPINVDAVVFWMVFSAKKACVEVEDYAAAVSWVAQTAMRKAIGRATVAEVAMRRDQLDAELKEALEEKLSPWGIDIIDVEVRDIVVPKELQAAMAAEAVAERKKNARMVLAEVERDISEMLKDASEVYDGDQDALRLRTMHLAYESVEKSGGTLVIPSAFSEGFVDPSGAVGGAGGAGGAGARGAQRARGARSKKKFRYITNEISGKNVTIITKFPFKAMKAVRHEAKNRTSTLRLEPCHRQEALGCQRCTPSGKDVFRPGVRPTELQTRSSHRLFRPAAVLRPFRVGHHAGSPSSADRSIVANHRGPRRHLAVLRRGAGVPPRAHFAEVLL